MSSKQLLQCSIKRNLTRDCQIRIARRTMKTIWFPRIIMLQIKMMKMMHQKLKISLLMTRIQTLEDKLRNRKTRQHLRNRARVVHKSKTITSWTWSKVRSKIWLWQVKMIKQCLRMSIKSQTQPELNQLINLETSLKIKRSEKLNLCSLKSNHSWLNQALSRT